ncbi:MAG: single-stranded DNA-binding protein [Bacteroidota bacterium]
MQHLSNHVQLIGHLGKDVEYKQLGEEGRGLARVSIATNDVRKNKNGEIEKDTQWHNIVGWGKTAEMMNNLFKKGKKVAIQGKLVHRSYDDKDGTKRYVSEVVVQEFMLLN